MSKKVSFFKLELNIMASIARGQVELEGGARYLSDDQVRMRYWMHYDDRRPHTYTAPQSRTVRPHGAGAVMQKLIAI